MERICYWCRQSQMQNIAMLKIHTAMIPVSSQNVNEKMKEFVQYNDDFYEGETPIPIHTYVCPKCGIVEKCVDSDFLNELNFNIERVTNSRVNLMKKR